MFISQNPPILGFESRQFYLSWAQNTGVTQRGQTVGSRPEKSPIPSVRQGVDCHSFRVGWQQHCLYNCPSSTTHGPFCPTNPCLTRSELETNTKELNKGEGTRKGVAGARRTCHGSSCREGSVERTCPARCEGGRERPPPSAAATFHSRRRRHLNLAVSFSSDPRGDEPADQARQSTPSPRT